MSFPIRFDPAPWHGPRATAFPDRSDAFQQLVGDGLREAWGWRVSVAPTEGRDGAIDAFVEAEAEGSAALAGLAAPQIIECKDHNDRRAGVQSNVVAGWRVVAEKLRRQAALGWPGNYQPWLRAKSYIYCVSAVLPNQQQRDRIEQSITSFFESLPAGQRPPIEAIRVLDWADLRHWLEALPRLADMWLGTGLPLVLSHGELCDRLKGFRRHLRPDVLPFISPEAGSRTDPDVIFHRLQALAGERGVVIKGVGGVGKTRTALEVCHRAEAAGWRVLHALPGEPGVTVEDIAKVLWRGTTPTLLVFDYLDQMPNLDLGSLRQRLLEEAQHRGLPLALLANLRPAALRQANVERDRVFTEELLLQPSGEQQLQITESVLDLLAPKAVAQLGRERVRELCGMRPILALFIATELERRAQAGSLLGALGGGLRGGDLLGWLRQRLMEDRLVVEGGSDFLPPEPPPELVAAAAMLAAAPLAPDAMVMVGQAAGLAAGGDSDRLAKRVLEELRTLGWLEATKSEYVAAHDVVADEVLEQVLRNRADGRWREAVLPWCLAPALSNARVLGRYATALSRMLGAEGEETESEGALRKHASQWLSAQAAGLGRELAAAAGSMSAYALGAVVSSPVWADASVANWSQLVSPWLAKYDRHASARHLLYKGLKALPEHGAAALVEAALIWCPRHQHLELASFVHGPLLGRTDLGDHVHAAIKHALDWLEHFKHAPEAQFVLDPLLGRSDLSGHANKAISLALVWLDHFKQAPKARFVFASLLGCFDLSGYANQAIVLALTWLGQFHNEPEAQYVLKPLLARSDLGSHTGAAIDIAMDWLEQFHKEPEAQYVFSSLLARSDLERNASAAVVYAMAWMEVNHHEVKAQFVFKPLLARSDLGSHASAAIEHAMDWLGQYNKEPEAQYVFSSLLARSDLGSHLSTAINYTIVWLGQFCKGPEARFVLRPLLARSDLGIHANVAINQAMAWLRQFQKELDAQFVLRPLLARSDLGSQASPAIDHAMAWVEKFYNESEASFVYRFLLARSDLGSHANAAINHAMAWLRQFHKELDAQFVLSSLLARSDLGSQASAAIDHAMAWVEKFHNEPEASFVYRFLLARSDLGSHANAAINHAMAWLRQFRKELDAQFVLSSLLARSDLGSHAKSAIDHAMGWLGQFHKEPEAQYVLRPLLGRSDLGRHTDAANDHAMDWLGQFHKEPEAQYVLRSLLARSDLGSHAKSAIDHAMVWLGQFHRKFEACSVLSRLLDRKELGDYSSLAISQAVTWLELFAMTEEAAFVFQNVIPRPELNGHTPRVVSLGIFWLERNSQSLNAKVVFNRMLWLPQLSDNDWRSVSRLALSWLRKNTSKINRDLNLASLLERHKLLSEDDKAWVKEQAFDWLRSPPKGHREPIKLLAAMQRLGWRADV